MFAVTTITFYIISLVTSFVSCQHLHPTSSHHPRPRHPRLIHTHPHNHTTQAPSGKATVSAGTPSYRGVISHLPDIMFIIRNSLANTIESRRRNRSWARGGGSQEGVSRSTYLCCGESGQPGGAQVYGTILNTFYRSEPLKPCIV